MSTIADIFRLSGEDYIKKQTHCILPSQIRAISDISKCQTRALGIKVYQCPECQYEKSIYLSCGNRSCPNCQHERTRQWIKNREKERLPVRYFHFVFTLPKQLRATALSHQKMVYNILMKAAMKSLKKLARDPKYVGGLIGGYSVLHTWDRALLYHPHVHCLVPGGGLSEDGSQWKQSKTNYFLPVKALSKLFRAIFMKMLRKALPDITFPQSLWTVSWVVFSKPAVQGTEKILQYLGRYIHRIAITNQRILSVQKNTVTFRYKDSKSNIWRTMTLQSHQFISRFVKHILPKNFHKVRLWGMFHPSKQQTLKQIQLRFYIDKKLPDSRESDEHPKTHTHHRCPNCNNILFVNIISKTEKLFWISNFIEAPT